MNSHTLFLLISELIAASFSTSGEAPASDKTRVPTFSKRHIYGPSIFRVTFQRLFCAAPYNGHKNWDLSLLSLITRVIKPYIH